ncbi:MAG TPA: enolase C-terminal domain-like protein [Candidatus Binatia bacterium]|nr:enolase C-terminal domain-like protein [Candidatus Binatia bacterium]
MRIRKLDATAYQVPTASPEADGTLAWDSTTLVLLEAWADSGVRGSGFSYASAVVVPFVARKLAPVVVGESVDDVGACWEKMVNAVRNVARPGIAAHAISAVDTALWDLKARSLGKPLFRLLSTHRSAVPIYGSGGFTSYDKQELVEQLAGWVQQGIPRVKMKVGMGWGTRQDEDVERVAAVRDAIGPDAELFVDANGGYTVKQAVRQARRFAEYDVTYFEEPVSSDQLQQLARVRAQTSLSVAAGEYGYDPWYFRDMLRAEAVDVLQADVTRCLGVTGWLMAADLAYAFDVPFSAHTAPAIHTHLGCAAPQIAHVEYFYDHARIEQMLFDGAPHPVDGTLRPDPDRPGLGLEFKRQDAMKWQVSI